MVGEIEHSERNFISTSNHVIILAFFLNTIGLKNDLELRIVNALIFFHRPDGVARKAGDVSVADWRYETRIKYYRNFILVQLLLLSGLDFLVKHRRVNIKSK